MTDSRTRLAYAVVRCALGAILLVAAALKAHQLATQPLAEDSVFSSRAVLTLWFEVEIVLGLWLFSGLFPRAALVAAMGCFSLFSAVTGFKALSGEPSCGCFGVVEVSLWYTLILDVGAVTALVLVRPDLRTSWPVPGVRRHRRSGEDRGTRYGETLEEWVF